MHEFRVPAISCNHCARAITEAMHEVDRDAKVQVDLATKVVRVEAAADRKVLVAALVEAGYQPE